MKRIILMISVVVVAVFAINLSVGSLNAEAAEKVYRWKIQSAYPRGDVSMELLNDFAADIKKKSNGRLLISVFADPELVPAEQLFEATKKGTIDMLHAVAAMWAGIIPVGEVEFGLPYAYNIPGNKDIVESGAIVREFFFKTGFADLLRKEYAKQGLYWLDMHSYGKLFTLSTKPIKTCDDMKGIKIRVEGSWADYYNMIGARGTYISGMEAYMGLKLGTIDASQWDVSAITGLNWHEVAPYWLIGGQNDVVPGNILVNQKSWNDLPDDLKAVLTQAAEDYYHLLLKVYVAEMVKVAELIKAGKVIESPIDEACERKHEEAAYKLWDEIGARDPVAAEAIQITRDWRKTLK
jgi:TRAP-type C4-dicarboxylate transport system substrate-binding protein